MEPESLRGKGHSLHQEVCGLARDLDEDAALLSGPALDSEGISQDDVDKLFESA